jgi:hypothetical protein
VPATIRFVLAPPMSATGKLVRHASEDDAAAGYEAFCVGARSLCGAVRWHRHYSAVADDVLSDACLRS